MGDPFGAAVIKDIGEVLDPLHLDRTAVDVRHASDHPHGVAGKTDHPPDEGLGVSSRGGRKTMISPRSGVLPARRPSSPFGATGNE